jgi:hypothetical protein
MTVRQISKTTVSAAVFVVGFIFFHLYYAQLLSMLAGLIYTLEDTNPFLYFVNIKLYPVENIDHYFVSLFYFCVIVILIVRIFNAVLSHSVALGFLSSFVQPIFLLLLFSAALMIEQLHILQLWAIFYLLIIISLHSTYHIILGNSTIIRNEQKKLKAFFVTLRKTIQNVKVSGIKSLSNPVDDFLILAAALGIMLLQLITLISFAVYLYTHWRIIFLSHLIQ